LIDHPTVADDGRGVEGYLFVGRIEDDLDLGVCLDRAFVQQAIDNMPEPLDRGGTDDLLPIEEQHLEAFGHLPRWRRCREVRGDGLHPVRRRSETIGRLRGEAG